MRSARLHGYKNIQIDNVEAPQPGDRQVTVDVAWCGICGSDLHAYTSPVDPTSSDLPIALGHEIAGRVRNPSSSSRFRDGDEVFVDPRILCRTCPACKMGKGHICERIAFIGGTKKRDRPAAHAGYGDTIVVDEDMVHELPPQIKLEFAAIIEPLSIVWHGIKVSGITDWATQSVLVLGGGPIGFALILCLRAVGAGTIIVSEPTETRREQLREFTTAVVNPITEDVVAECQSYSDGQGVDVVFDCSGVQAALDAGFNAVKSEGMYVMLAVWKAPMIIPSWELLYKHITLKGTLTIGNGKAFQLQTEVGTTFQAIALTATLGEVAEVIQMIAEGKLKRYEKMVTGRIHLEDINKKGFEELIVNRDDHIKILVTPGGELAS